jgi:hypothetical protein
MDTLQRVHSRRPNTMPLLLLEVAAHPGEIAATQVGRCIRGQTFLLDFSRPLRAERWCGVWNKRFGYLMALHVPVVHEREAAGTRTITVDRGDPYFAELQRLWRERHPRHRPAPAGGIDAPDVAADFALHFAEGTAAASPVVR